MAVHVPLAVSCSGLVTREEFVGLPGVLACREKSSDRRMGGRGGQGAVLTLKPLSFTVLTYAVINLSLSHALSSPKAKELFSFFIGEPRKYDPTFKGPIQNR